MKRLFQAAGLLVLGSTLWASEAAYPAGSQGSVTLDWQKFDTLWARMHELEKTIEKLENPEHLPPLPFTLTRAAYKGEVFGKRVEMNAIYEIDVYAQKDWVKVPFLPGSVAVREAKLDGRAAGLSQENGYHTLILKGSGRHVLEVRFWLKMPAAEQAPYLHLDVPTTPITLLSMRFPKKDLDVTVEPSNGIEVTNVDGKTLVTAAIPPTGGIDLRWQKSVPEDAAGPAKLYVDNQALVSVVEGSVRSHWMLNYNILHRGIRSVRIGVPEGWNVTNVTGDGVQEWKPVTSKSGTILLVDLAFARKGALTLVVDAERGLGEKEEVVEIPRIVPLDVEREQGMVGVEARGALELASQEALGLNAVDPQELSPSIWGAATQPILLAYRYTKPFTLALSIKRHPEVAVLTTAIDDANAVTLMTARGQLVTHVRYQVRNHLKQYLSLTLPQGAELWSAFVGGQPVKPTRVQGQQYRIPLSKSQIGSASAQAFPVEVVYYLPIDKFHVGGRRLANFPVPDAPVSRLLWSMYLPEHYRFMRFGGDFEKSPQTLSLASAIGGARVQREDFAEEKGNDQEGAKAKSRKEYRLRDMAALMGKMTSMDEANAPASPSVARQVALESDVLMNRTAATREGVFPVAFQVPASGQLFRFGQVMIVGESPWLSVWFVHERVVQGLLMIAFLLMGMFLYWQREIILQTLKAMAARIHLPARLINAPQA